MESNQTCFLCRFDSLGLLFVHFFLQPRIGPFSWGQAEGWFAWIGCNLETWIPPIWEGLQVLREFGRAGRKTSSPLAWNQFHPSGRKSWITKRVSNPRRPWAICCPSLECYVSQVQLVRHHETGRIMEGDVKSCTSAHSCTMSDCILFNNEEVLNITAIILNILYLYSFIDHSTVNAECQWMHWTNPWVHYEGVSNFGYIPKVWSFDQRPRSTSSWVSTVGSSNKQWWLNQWLLA